MYRGQKRTDYMSWDDYFMNVAVLAAMRSKDPSTQVGACMVNSDNVIVGVGYNGFPTGISDDSLPWGKGNHDADSDPMEDLDSKYPYVCHAQMNAILNRTPSVDKRRSCRIYTTLFPCSECCKLICQTNVDKIIYCDDKHGDKESWIAGKRMLAMAGVKTVAFVPKSFSIDFSEKRDDSTDDRGIVRVFSMQVKNQVKDVDFQFLPWIAAGYLGCLLFARLLMST
eukprot:GEMP01027587.1.p1 GENE.GEMP01027587.1~~GEMP01027587.1.p1  ORF type:complete len:234 (+),score=35.15 GEMP01027587.1:29-703(+)